jgi:hypothetical protein
MSYPTYVTTIPNPFPVDETGVSQPPGFRRGGDYTEASNGGV